MWLLATSATQRQKLEGRVASYDACTTKAAHEETIQSKKSTIACRADVIMKQTSVRDPCAGMKRSIKWHCNYREHVIAAIIACTAVSKLHTIAATAPGISPPLFWHFSVIVSEPPANTSTQVRPASFLGQIACMALSYPNYYIYKV